MTSRPRRPDRAVYVPRARRSQTTPPSSSSTPNAPPSEAQQSTVPTPPSPTDSPPKDTSFLPTQTNRTTRSSAPSSPAAKQQSLTSTPQTQIDQQQIVPNTTSVHSLNHPEAITNGGTNSNCDIRNKHEISTAGPFGNISGGLEDNHLEQPARNHQSTTNNDMDNHIGGGLRIEDAQYDQTRHHNAKEDKDEKELQRASKVSDFLIE